ncbi:unnamed protein product [Ilex paraguariensis]|uniref:Uncharacterized protein n=1 Tax=Ilex paraguariensis TaxID=185542 RepID=A0ABC8S759_9AQUA
MRTPHRFRALLYKELIGIVSTSALDKIQVEAKKIGWIEIDPDHFTITPYVEENAHKTVIELELDMLMNMFFKSIETQKVEIKKRLQALTNPGATSLIESVTKVDLRGRKKKKRVKKTIVTLEESIKCNPSGFEYVLESFEESQTKLVIN